MTCREIDEAVTAWRIEGSLEPARFEAVSEHLDGCVQCRTRYGALLPFMRRDAGYLPELAESPAGDPAFTAAVMSRVLPARRAVPLRRAAVGASFRSHWRLVAAAAAVMIVFGTVLVARGAMPTGDTVTVHFVLDAPGAAEVALVGNFTDWNPNRLLLKREGHSNRWELSVRLKRGETYLYNFVIDRELWIPDPGSAEQVSDGFGGKSTLMQL